jgi:hypothetical protein
MANGTIAASQLEMLSLSGTGIITITPPATNTNRAITLPDAAGALVVSGTTPSLNGITFPATQVASADANTLDDYEEGTWTPSAFDGGGTGITYVASYVKIGRQVTCFFAINGTGLTTTAAGTTLSGLPFAPSNVPTGSNATYMGISQNGQTNNSGAIQAFSDSKIYFAVTYSSTTQISGTVTYLTST